MPADYFVSCTQLTQYAIVSQVLYLLQLFTILRTGMFYMYMTTRSYHAKTTQVRVTHAVFTGG